MNEKSVAGESMSPGRRLAWGLTATWLVQVVGTAAMFGVHVLAPAIAMEMGVDATLVGVYVAIAYLTGQLSGLACGGFVDRYGALRMSQVSCLFAALGIVTLFPAHVWLAPVAAVFMGICYGPLNPTSTAILRGLGNQNRQPLIFSVKQTGVPSAGVLVGMSLPAVTAMYDWRIAFGLYAVIAIVVALAIQPVREVFDHRRDRDGGRPKIAIWGPLKMVLRDPALRALALVGFATSDAPLGEQRLDYAANMLAREPAAQAETVVSGAFVLASTSALVRLAAFIWALYTLPVAAFTAIVWRYGAPRRPRALRDDADASARVCGWQRAPS